MEQVKHNILILSSGLKLNEGNLSFSLMNELANRGHNVRIVTDYYTENHPNIRSYYKQTRSFFRKNIGRIQIFFSGYLKRPKVNNRYYFQDIYEPVTFRRTSRLLRLAGFTPNAIFVHYNQGFVNSKNLSELSRTTGAPVFIHLIDMAPLTGGCHYAWDCKQYLNRCGNCPALKSSKKSDLSTRIFKYRKRNFSKANIRIIAATEWQLGQAKQSGIFKNNPINKVLFGFNELYFKPALDKKSIRAKYGLPTNKFVILFGASGLEEERKGIKHFIEAINILVENGLGEKIHILLAGKAESNFLEKLKVNYTLLGYINVDDLIRAYQISDVFVSASIEDSGPSMINQSLLCGLPVVAFNMGAAPDLVINNVTGYKAILKDSNDLANGIIQIIKLNELEYESLSKSCRSFAIEMCSVRKECDSLIQLIGNARVN